MNNNRNLSKEELYQSVKTLLETSDPHIHLTQHKLFTLFSIAFQYLLFQSTKNPGIYLIRVEDGVLAEKLAQKAKDQTTRNFFSRILLPKKMRYERSTIYLDFFRPNTWSKTNELDKNKVKLALVIKNTSEKPMDLFEELSDNDDESTDQTMSVQNPLFEDKTFYYNVLKEFVPKSIIIAYQQDIEDVKKITFPFIPTDEERALSGVKITENLKFD